MDDDEATRLVRGAADAIPPIAATPAKDLIHGGQRIQRRQRILAVSGIAAAVAMVTAGGLAVHADDKGVTLPTAERTSSTPDGAVVRAARLGGTSPSQPLPSGGAPNGGPEISDPGQVTCPSGQVASSTIDDFTEPSPKATIDDIVNGWIHHRTVGRVPYIWRHTVDGRNTTFLLRRDGTAHTRLNLLLRPDTGGWYLNTVDACPPKFTSESHR